MTLAPLLARIGWTAPEMGRRAGYSAGHASDLTEGRRQPRPELIAWLEDVAAAVEAVGPAPRMRGQQKAA